MWSKGNTLEDVVVIGEEDDNMNERKEQQAINETLLQNMTRGNSHGKPTHSTNRFKKYMDIFLKYRVKCSVN